jgi:hypothetical protein
MTILAAVVEDVCPHEVPEISGDESGKRRGELTSLSSV